MSDVGSSTLAIIKKNVSCDEDAGTLMEVWEQMRACGATSWEIDVPDNAALRLRVVGITEVPLSVHRELATKPRVRDIQVNSDPHSIDVSVWTFAFNGEHPDVTQQPPMRMPGKDPRIQLDIPSWCDRSERETISDIVATVHRMYKYSPRLSAETEQTPDGLRFKLHIHGFHTIPLNLLDTIIGRHAQVQDTVVTLAPKTPTLGVSMTLVRSAVLTATKRKRNAGTAGAVFKRVKT